jgi:diguanylate cyclase (GGDEF)-like protein
MALLSLFMRSSIRSASLKYWTGAWCSLSVALIALFIGFHVETAKLFFYSAYFFGEYAFGLLFIAGINHYIDGTRLEQRHLYLLIPAAAVALLLPHASRDFNNLFMIHATILAGLFAASFFALRPAQKRRGAGPGLHVMSVALVLLAVDFLHDVPLFGARNGLWGITVPAGYLQYTSIFDLILEILLGFGTMMVLLEGVRGEVEAANLKLTQARDQLERMARMDPLTEALNRHAFHSLVNRDESDVQADVSGSVAVIDIDNLKPINDQMGHSVGDRAIRSVARSVRSLIRADDMLFRWGGDEFLVLMFRLHEAEATRRMQSLNEILERISLLGSYGSATVSVSFGVAGFGSLDALGLAIEAADKSMYRSRQAHRAGDVPVDFVEAKPAMVIEAERSDPLPA